MIGNDFPARVLAGALDASALRQRVLAHNIANVNTPGFKRSQVEFEQHLATAMMAGDDPSQVKPVVVAQTDSVGRPDGNNVDVELEMTQVAENQLKYAALTRALSDHFARLRLAIYEGRR